MLGRVRVSIRKVGEVLVNVAMPEGQYSGQNLPQSLFGLFHFRSYYDT